jgi:hypothetical protein
MPVEDYEGNTFVAFLDISGFKILMRDERRALRALDRFYETGYWVLHHQNNTDDYRVDGFFISDSGILFVRNGREGTCQQLVSVLRAVERINREMLNDDFMLTTSIAYGHFRYRGRFEFTGIEKNPIYGGAYVKAFLDNENGSPKIQPGQCRVIKRNLPTNFDNLSSYDYSSFPLLKRLKDVGNHYQFYWMVDDKWEIKDFEKQYNNAYDLKYAGMLKALKREA